MGSNVATLPLRWPIMGQTFPNRIQIPINLAVLCALWDGFEHIISN